MTLLEFKGLSPQFLDRIDSLETRLQLVEKQIVWQLVDNDRVLTLINKITELEKIIVDDLGVLKKKVEELTR